MGDARSVDPVKRIRGLSTPERIQSNKKLLNRRASNEPDCVQNVTTFHFAVQSTRSNCLKNPIVFGQPTVSMMMGVQRA
jgi:hypothetical protein